MMTGSTAIHIVGLCGSLRETSYTRFALNVALQGAISLGAHTSLIDLKDLDLVFCAGKIPDHEAPPGVLRLRQDLRKAQGIIIGTPIYHGSFTGVLKNALDLTGFEEFSGKVLGLLSVAGGTMSGVEALNSLRSIGRSLHAWVIPEQVSIPQAWKAFDDAGHPLDENLLNRMEDLGQQVTRFAYLLHSKEAKAFLEAWENAPQNPGGGES